MVSDARYCLLDTNVVVRFLHPLDDNSLLARKALEQCRTAHEKIFITPQILKETWVALTRPLTSPGGFGVPPLLAGEACRNLLALADMLEDHADIWQHWLEMVQTREIKGKKAHDAYLVSFMHYYKIGKLVTFNTKDFFFAKDFQIVHPRELA